MKTNRIFSIVNTGVTLAACLFLVSPTQAQTFNRARQLTEVPKIFEALIYPVANRPQTIRINFDNPIGKAVRVMIRNESGNLVYDEYKNVVASREYYDLSPLPVGNYTVDLTTTGSHVVKPFTIEASQAGAISMDNQTERVISEVPTRKQLVVRK
ncbi:hypothetical protein [Spirosoma spitsbergense]|uniref:hypothetical protein n=1 Tax=Spirosoma spitsbergense TaxID=431554 RepID=UPI00037CE62A|nr:hypothetical protein [Spirosoma spitsbergense]